MRIQKIELGVQRIKKLKGLYWSTLILFVPLIIGVHFLSANMASHPFPTIVTAFGLALYWFINAILLTRAKCPNCDKPFFGDHGHLFLRLMHKKCYSCDLEL